MESKLPDEVQDQINQEAFNKSLILKNERRGASFCLGYEAGYVEGATEWAIWKVKHDQLKEELRQSQLSVTSLRYSLDQRDRQLFELKDKADKMEAALESIKHKEKASGREGCTWGDTEFDSLSATAGYNEAVQQCSDTASKALAWKEWEKEEKPEHNVSIGDHITYCHECGFPVDECNCEGKEVEGGIH